MDYAALCHIDDHYTRAHPWSAALPAADRSVPGGRSDFWAFFGYIPCMVKVSDRLSPQEIAAARQRRLEAMNLQAIEGNPLDEEDVAMFEMFEREGWDDERCIAYILRACKSSCQAIKENDARS